MKDIKMEKATVFVIILIIPVVAMAGCNEPGREDGVEVRFTLILDDMVSRDQEGETVWDAIITIDEIDPYDMDYTWRMITISVRIGSYTDIPGATPNKYEGEPSRFGGIAFWYDEWSGNPESADPMDQIVITSITEEYLNALVIINYRGESSGSFYLPEEFTE